MIYNSAQFPRRHRLLLGSCSPKPQSPNLNEAKHYLNYIARPESGHLFYL